MQGFPSCRKVTESKSSPLIIGAKPVRAHRHENAAGGRQSCMERRAEQREASWVTMHGATENCRTELDVGKDSPRNGLDRMSPCRTRGQPMHMYSMCVKSAARTDGKT